MIFIKNYCEDLSGKNTSLVLTEEKEGVQLDLFIATEAEDFIIPLVKSQVVGVGETMEKSLKYIANITKVSTEDAGSLTVGILDDKPSEVSFFVKGAKTVIKEHKTMPNVIDTFEEVEDSAVRYPRDLCVFILPNTVNDTDVAKYSLVMDKRNLGGETVIQNIGPYTICIVYIKFPLWANLKFPAYGYFKANLVNDTSVDMGAFKLGYATIKRKNRPASKNNKIVNVDMDEARNYLTESFRILREKAKERKESRPVNRERSYDRPVKNDRKPGKFNNDRKRTPMASDNRFGTKIRTATSGSSRNNNNNRNGKKPYKNNRSYN